MSNRNLALAGATIVACIYGITFTVAKDVMPNHVAPFGLIFIRVFGACILFWIASLFTPYENIQKKDIPWVIAAAFFGVAFNQLTFFKGLNYTSPISASVIMITAPIMVWILSVLFLKEGWQIKKIIGIIIGLTGTSLLILYGKKIPTAPKPSLGNFLVFLNAFSYSFYLIIIKKLVGKYQAITFIKWIYTFGFFLVLPFGWKEFNTISWQELPTDILLKIAYLVIFTTFLAYLINLMAMRHLKATTLSVFIYLQPLVATVFAISLKKDQLNFVTLIASVLIFLGVFLVTHQKSK